MLQFQLDTSLAMSLVQLHKYQHQTLPVIDILPPNSHHLRYCPAHNRWQFVAYYCSEKLGLGAELLSMPLVSLDHRNYFAAQTSAVPMLECPDYDKLAVAFFFHPNGLWSHLFKQKFSSIKSIL